MKQVLLNPELMGYITTYQEGYSCELWPFRRYIKEVYINRGPLPRHSSVCPNFLLRRDLGFLLEQLHSFGNIFQSWLKHHSNMDIPQLFQLDDRYYMIVLHYAIYRHDIDLFDYLYKKKQIKSFLAPTMIASVYGSLPILKYLHENNASGFLPATMDWAAQHGHLHVVKYLHSVRSEGCTTQAMDLAAWQGHLEVVQFLHDYRQEGCTTMAMNQAATYGHLHVVEFLHKNRIEGCTAVALDYASCHGHLEVVKFLHYNRIEGCTTKAMDSAACAGHLHIVEFLHVNRKEGCTHRALESAAECKRYDVVLYLVDVCKEQYLCQNIEILMALSEARRRYNTAMHQAEHPSSLNATSTRETSCGGWQIATSVFDGVLRVVERYRI